MKNTRRRKAAPVIETPGIGTLPVGQSEPGKVAILYPSTGHDLSTRFVRCLFELERTDRNNGVGLFDNFVGVETGCNISKGRNRLVHHFLTEMPESEWACFIDTDMVFEPDVLYRLITAARTTEIPIMGALCVIVTATSPIPTIFRDDPNTVTQAALDYPDDTILEVAATGCGCLLIHRSVLVSMQEAAGGSTNCWFFEEEVTAENGASFWIGEDISFCLRARKLGHKVGVDCTTHVGHHKGPRVWWPADIRTNDTHPTFAITFATENTFDRVQRLHGQGGYSRVYVLGATPELAGNSSVTVLDYPENTTAEHQLNEAIELILAQHNCANIVLVDDVEGDQMLPRMSGVLRSEPRTTAVELGTAAMFKGEFFHEGYRFSEGSHVFRDIEAAGGFVKSVDQ